MSDFTEILQSQIAEQRLNHATYSNSGANPSEAVSPRGVVQKKVLIPLEAETPKTIDTSISFDAQENVPPSGGALWGNDAASRSKYFHAMEEMERKEAAAKGKEINRKLEPTGFTYFDRLMQMGAV